MIEHPKRVRLAQPADEDALMDLLTNEHDGLHTENGFGRPLSHKRVREHVEISTRQQGGICGIIDGKDEIAGAVAVLMQTWWYSDEMYLSEGFLYVRPDYRCNGFERDLFQFCLWQRERFTEAMGQEVPLITQVWSPRRLESKTRLWRRNVSAAGGRQVASVFLIDGVS